MKSDKPLETDEAGFFVFCLRVYIQTVARFDRQIAGATSKYWLNRRLSDTSHRCMEAIFSSDFWRDFDDLHTTAFDASKTLATKKF